MTNQSFPDITSITSEALQLKIRQLLPSQTGFGSDLMAQNIIVPTIDLTATAEGSDVRADLQSALAFGSITSNSVYNTTSTISNVTGFVRLFGIVSCGGNGGTGGDAFIFLTDGSTNKIVSRYRSISHATGQDSTQQISFDFLVYSNLGESVQATTNAQAIMEVCVRQIADSNGTLVQPAGFDPQ
jgi:hypothetical protein